MTTNPLRLLIIPAISIVFYLVASYITLSIICYAYGLGSLAELISYTSPSIGMLAPVVIFESLPLFLISLLFTMQYSMTSANLKNIGYASFVAITMAVVKPLLIILFLYIPSFMGQNSDYQILMKFSLWPISILFIALLFIAVSLVSHYYFRWTQQEVNPIEINSSALISSISYVLLVLCPPVVTGMLFAISFNSSDAYSYFLYDQIGQQISSITSVYIIVFVYLFILVLFWTQDIIKKYFALNTYAISTLRAYIFTQFSYIVLYALLTCIALLFNDINPRDIFDNISLEFIIVILMVITVVLLFVLARLVKGIGYKIYHFTTCVIFIGWIYLILPSYRHGMMDTLAPIVLVLFAVCLSLCFFALCTRISLKGAFK